MKALHLRALQVGAAAIAISVAGLAAAQAANGRNDPARPIVPAVSATQDQQDDAEASKSIEVSNRDAAKPVTVYLDPKSRKATREAITLSDNTDTVSTPAGDGKTLQKKSVRASRYSALVSRFAKEHGVPLTLAHAVVRIESNFNPKARGSAGEIGLMQIKPATARGMGFSGNAKDLYDPATNLRWGMKYLAGAHRLAGGDTCGTILRYNGGHYAKRMNPISARYCRKVQALLKSGEAKAYASL